MLHHLNKVISEENSISIISKEIFSFIGFFSIFSVADISIDHNFQHIKFYWLENVVQLQPHYQDDKQQVMPNENSINTLFVTFYPDLNIQNVSAQFANDRFSFWYVQWYFLDPQLVNKILKITFNKIACLLKTIENV